MLRIVIAEPDEVLTLWLQAAIAPAPGFEVVGTAVDGACALDVVRHARPDVALVDVDIVMLPRGGLTLVAAITEASPETLVFVLAAGALEDVARDALAAGAAGVLAKDGSTQILTDVGWSGPGDGRDRQHLSSGRHVPPAAHDQAHSGMH